MNIQLIILQIIAHVLSDYFLQTNKSAKDKNKKGFKSKFLIKHVLITFICSWILSFDINFVFCSFGISITHYFIDGFKKQFNTSRYSFYIDQFLHILFILFFVWCFEKYFVSNKIIEFTIHNKWLFLFLSYIVCSKPANIFIRETFLASKIMNIVSTSNELENAGKLIGTLERILVLTFVVIEKWEVIGFLIAAKSILRYKDTDTIKTEYVLIGTMLSFGTAILLGILFNQF